MAYSRIVDFGKRRWIMAPEPGDRIAAPATTTNECLPDRQAIKALVGATTGTVGYGVISVDAHGIGTSSARVTLHRNDSVQTRAVFQGGLAMSDRERRDPKDGESLSKEQLATLHTMEQFHWKLRFVRRPLFRAPVPVLFHRDGTRFVVLEADGSINEDPGFKIRP
jgi:hypothetical protein